MLDILEILQGSFSLGFVLISIIIGLKIMSTYFKHRNRTFLLVGFAWIGLANPWIPDSINFLMYLISGQVLEEFYYLLIGNAFIPLFVLSWLTAFTDLKYTNKQKMVIALTTIGSIIFEVAFLLLLTTNTILIGESLGHFQYEFRPFIEIYLVTIILIVLITGILFGLESMKSEDRKINWKGRFIIIAFILFSVGAILDSSIDLTPITVVITRVILISSSISFYIGFIFPKSIEKLLLK
ncbi:MAG: hypothetical protein ACOC44_07380 [Promethearchaeia archaeon]